VPSCKPAESTGLGLFCGERGPVAGIGGTPAAKLRRSAGSTHALPVGEAADRSASAARASPGCWGLGRGQQHPHIHWPTSIRAGVLTMSGRLVEVPPVILPHPVFLQPTG